MAKDLGIHSPVSEIFESEDEAVRFLESCVGKKMIIKPADNVGSNGVIDTEENSDLRALVDFAFSKSRSHKIVIEDFIEGDFAPATAMIINKKVVAFFCDLYYRYNGGKKTEKRYPIYDQTNGIAQPCPYIDEFADDVIEDFNKIAEALNLVDGKFHCELMITPDHKAYIFDVHRRMSGFPYPWSEWDHSTGMNWCDWIVKAECGMDLSDFPMGIKQTNLRCRRDIYAPRDGHILSVKFDEYLTSHLVPKREEKNFMMYDFVVTDYVNQPLTDSIESFFKPGIRFGETTANFAFDDMQEFEYFVNPANNEEFYSHLTFTYE